jgi:2-dehydro-3-deoxyglucarate aldolase/4-hydroxy-2-oxoheptanedioate aldolase
MADQSLRRRVMSGQPVHGAMVFECTIPGIGQMLQNAGCAFALFDMEHAGLGYESFKMLAATFRGLDIVPMVRVPRGEYHFLARALDLGAQGVMVPMVESAEAARAIAEACRYPPRGRRGAAFGFAHDDYGGGDLAAKIMRLDERNLVIAQIETERGLQQVDAIAAVDGIDVLWVGHFDLTNFLGIPGAFDHPSFAAALDRVVGAARRHGKGAGFLASDRAWMARAKAHGFNMLAAGPDQAILTAGYRAILAPDAPA